MRIIGFVFLYISFGISIILLALSVVIGLIIGAMLELFAYFCQIEINSVVVPHKMIDFIQFCHSYVTERIIYFFKI